MKNLTMSATLVAALAMPSISNGSTLFPDLTFPSNWETTTGQELVKAPIKIQTVPAEE